ncbi:MAG: glycosyltransferase family 9 protein [Candidatus Omnitrophota bacterium]
MNKRILIVNTFGIGDVLFTTLLVKTLKKSMPDADIDFMCNERAQYIFRDNGNIRDIIIFEKDEFRKAFRDSKIGFIGKLAAFIKKLKSKRYDLLIDLSLGYQLSLLMKLLGVKKRIGFNFKGRGRFLTEAITIDGFSDKHVIDYYLDVLKLLGIGKCADKELEFALSEELEGWAAGFMKERGLSGRTVIGLAPGGGKSWGGDASYRRWAPENFSYVARKITEKFPDVYFFIFGSGEESCLCRKIEKDLAGRVTDLCGRLTLSQSAALIKRCSLMVCNDGGILHISVSQKVRTVSIFGPVDDRVYGPYPGSPRDKVAVAKDVKCRPCYSGFKHNICEVHDCLKKIDREAVLRMAEENLKERYKDR